MVPCVNGVYTAKVMAREIGQTWHLSNVLDTTWFCAEKKWIALELTIENVSLEPSRANTGSCPSTRLCVYYVSL